MQNSSQEWIDWDTQHAGLKNSGNSCYMSAALQFMLAARPFHETFGRLRESGDQAPSSTSSPEDNFAEALNKLVMKMTATERSVTATGFRYAAARGHADFSSSNQEDSMEYFLHLLSMIEDSLAEGNLKQPNPCDRLRIELCEEILKNKKATYVRREEYVLSCPIPTPKEPEPDYRADDNSTYQNSNYSNYSREVQPSTFKPRNLPPPPPGAPLNAQYPLKSKQGMRHEPHKASMAGWQEVVLEECIDQFFQQESIISQDGGEIFKTSRIATFPEYLVVQLRRFVLDRYGRASKLSILANVADQLDLKKWKCKSDWKKKCLGLSSSTDGSETKYHLKAFVTHIGSVTYHGHYTCHVKHDDRWHIYDDSQVTKVSQTDKERDKKRGYFYLYEREDVHCSYMKRKKVEQETVVDAKSQETSRHLHEQGPLHQPRATEQQNMSDEYSEQRISKSRRPQCKTDDSNTSTYRGDYRNPQTRHSNQSTARMDYNQPEWP